MKYIILLLLFSTTILPGQDLSRVQFLAGTWQVENRESYEVWMQEGDELHGESYRVKEGQKRVVEGLVLRVRNGNVEYVATVYNQNSGKAIVFRQTSDKEWLVFENPDHDFPKKIMYRKVNENELEVRVTGDNNQGFGYRLMRIKD